MGVMARVLVVALLSGWLAGCGVSPQGAPPAPTGESAGTAQPPALSGAGVGTPRLSAPVVGRTPPASSGAGSVTRPAGAASAASEAGAASGAGATPATGALPSLAQARAAHTATLLADGSVLVVGGFADGERATASAERFDPALGRFVQVGAMLAARQSHTATALPDGRVLLAGGFDNDALASAELYDPATGRFSATGPLTMARSGHRAILLPTGKVLLVGGIGTGWTFLASAELYDPATGQFTATGAMATPRESHTATLLRDGRVLVAGGHQGRRAAIVIHASAELYDPGTGVWSATGGLTTRRHKHDATILADGRVFLSGGADERDAQGVYASTEIYDPATGRFSVAATLRAARYKHTDTSIVLPDGRVLLLGGAGAAELYDPATDTTAPSAAGAGVPRLFATATPLRDRTILVVGGYGPGAAADGRAWRVGP